MEKISIIIPVYNAEPYLKKCLESVTRQTYKNLEIILVDDGSTDASGSICDEYAKKDKRCIVIHKTNGGLSAARNTGLEITTGDYIGFVDSDDWIALDMYEILLSLCKTYCCDIAAGGIREVLKEQETERIFKEDIRLYSQREYLMKFFRVNSQEPDHYAWNKLYRREVLRNVRYPEKLIDEDVEGTFRALLNAKKIVGTNKTLYFYRYTPDSITKKPFGKEQFDLITVWENVWRLSQKYCDKEMQYYAKVNRYRADFGILSKLAIKNINKSELEIIEAKKADSLKSLKGHSLFLLKAPIPFNRKLIILLFCVNDNMTSKLMRACYKIKKKAGTDCEHIFSGRF